MRSFGLKWLHLNKYHDSITHAPLKAGAPLPSRDAVCAAVVQDWAGFKEEAGIAYLLNTFDEPYKNVPFTHRVVGEVVASAVALAGRSALLRSLSHGVVKEVATTALTLLIAAFNEQ